MKTTTRSLLVSLVSLLMTNATVAADAATGAELEVIHAMALITTRDASRPLDYLYFESDFSASGNVAASMANPDRTEFCGLTREQGQALVNALIDVNARPVALDKTIARDTQLGLGQKKLPRFRYLMLSRVVFGPDNQQAWVAVDQNGETGAIIRLERIGGEWRKTARCGGWIRSS